MIQTYKGYLCLQWLRLLLTPRNKFKTGDERQAYAIDHPEPLLHFALCSGSHSDPAVLHYPSFLCISNITHKSVLLLEYPSIFECILSCIELLVALHPTATMEGRSTF